MSLGFTLHAKSSKVGLAIFRVTGPRWVDSSYIFINNAPFCIQNHKFDFVTTHCTNIFSSLG